MSKLIGTNPNQVPSNADLGSAAFMDAKDFLTARGSSLSAIDAVVPKTAVDVFIYDTSKDSDGGAWRKRTQDTSWYNEPLNTTIRGSRREFPAVAVIVATSASLGETKVIIYDADDPTLPMWMELSARGATNAQNATTLGWFTSGTPVLTTIFALNGILTCGLVGGINQVKFVSDSFRIAYSSYSYSTPNNISQRDIRNVVDEGSGGTGGDIIIDYVVNDVAMAVLPNAPIDSTTGLPIPTIAVATNSGLSVIKDDGTVVSSSSYDGTRVAWTSNYKIVVNAFENVSPADAVFVLDYPSLTVLRTYRQNTIPAITNSNTVNNGFHNAISTSPNRIYGANYADGGSYPNTPLVFIDYYDLSENQSTDMVCYIASNYNTGWMNGDNRLVALSDTNANDISSSGNTNLASGKTWTNASSFPYETLTISGLNITSAINTTAYGAVGFTWTPVIGRTYTVSFDLTLNSGSAPELFPQSSSSWGNGVTFLTKNGSNRFTFTATTSVSSYLNFSVNTGVATNFSVSNFELYEGGDPDRSKKNSGIPVFGTIKKTPVAAGAELVSYSGFSASNYLEQPHNSGLSFGVDDFSVMCWFNSSLTTGAGYLFDRGDSAGHSRIAAYLQPNGNVVTYTTNSAGTVAFAAYANSYTNSAWLLYTAVRRSGVIYTYVNGRLLGSFSQGQSLNNNDAPLSVGTRYNKVEGFVGSLALMRWSATAPSEEQIKKIYEDEKVLFQENAKCTLYGGTSVGALAYDNDTNLLHVGNTSGRNVFQGLRRIDNTTDAATTAISAANGMVVEE